MRKDLNKQLCERERHMSKDHYSNYRHDKVFKQDQFRLESDNDEYYDERNIVHGGHRESMTIRYVAGGWGKSFSENLNPLWGIVRKNVGRKWDDVYSELCEVFDKRSVINNHILEHLFQWVETKTFIGEDGQIWASRSYGGPRPLTDGRYVQYYVHPETGILCALDNKSYRQECRERAESREKEHLKIRRILNPTTELRCIDNVWYEVKFEDVKGKSEVHWTNPGQYTKSSMYNITVYPERYDVLLRTHVATNRVAVSKRQLSSKEKKKHNLI